ncbi:MAG: MBOAT family protein [Eubacterium sp.]|nr:MBOAT family protein [Eubacterium sp.]
MLYYMLVFGMLFLPLTIILYQLFPKRFRWVALLLASMGFYFSFSLNLFIFVVIATGVIYAAGLLLEKMNRDKKNALKALKSGGSSDKEEKAKLKAAYQKKSRLILTLGILMILASLLYLKYYNFFAENINTLFHASEDAPILAIKTIALPLGISFFSMQAISYMADVYWGKFEAQKNPLKLLLYLCFFPTVMEGPITLYGDLKDQLYTGNSIDPYNIISGYIRLFWGIMKKLVIADRMYPAVVYLFNPENETKGVSVIAAAVLFTVMEYMEFSGCMDMVIGIANVFGIKLPENFRQPFLARNASEFWRRWHISLGVWFKTYIFYPVSMSNLSKKWNKFARGKINAHITKVVASAMALLPVWLCNGLWHGPKWTYIFYGVFYFVVILLELLLEPIGDGILKLLHTSKENKIVNIIRIFKTWLIIFAGELFFQADSLTQGFSMFRDIFKDFQLSILWDGTALYWGLDKYDWLVVLAMLIVVIIVNLIREKVGDISAALLKKPMLVRWVLVLALLMVITIFGCYGPGFEEVDFIYAGF